MLATHLPNSSRSLQISQFTTDGRTPEQKAKDVEGIGNWVRDPKDKAGPETAPFKKVDGTGCSGFVQEA
jgi:hypothetical protein